MHNYSSGISIVSGHKKDNNHDTGWIKILKIKNHATIVLMDLTKAEEILNHGIGLGVDLPVAIISKASTKNQKVIALTFII
jgi:siroheme synthase